MCSKRTKFCAAVARPRAGREASLADFVDALRAALGKGPIHRREPELQPITHAWARRHGGLFETEQREAS